VLERLEDEIFHHAARVSEYNLKLRQANDGIYKPETAQKFEYSRNAHREALRSVVVQWLAEVEKAKYEAENERREIIERIVYGRW